MKKLIARLLTALLIVSLLALPASASTAYQYMRADIYQGATVSSQQSKKTTTSNTMLYFLAKPATSDGWASDGSEYVWFRGRNVDGTQHATEAVERNNTGGGVGNSLRYLPQMGSINKYYRMAIQYADRNYPKQWVKLQVEWTA